MINYFVSLTICLFFVVIFFSVYTYTSNVCKCIYISVYLTKIVYLFLTIIRKIIIREGTVILLQGCFNKGTLVITFLECQPSRRKMLGKSATFLEYICQAVNRRHYHKPTCSFICFSFIHTVCYCNTKIRY